MGLLGKVRSTITHPLIAGPLGGGFVVLLAYMDSKYREVDREKSTYIKLFIVSSLVFSTLTYFVSAEHNKTDEFLNQNYDTKLPTLLPKSKGGFALDEQPLMDGPSDHISKMMEGLPEPGTYKIPVESNVTMTMKPKSRRSGRSGKSGRSSKPRRSGRSKRYKKR